MNQEENKKELSNVSQDKEELIKFYDSLPDDKKCKFMSLIRSLEKAMGIDQTSK